MDPITSVDTVTLDATATAVGAAAEDWSQTPLSERIALLERMMPRIVEQGAALVTAAVATKGYRDDSHRAAEDWMTGPWAIAQNVSAYLHVLRRIAAGRAPVPASAVHERHGRTLVDVFPSTGWDRLLLNGFRAQVWLRPGVTPQQALGDAAIGYRGRPRPPATALVLGAGNVAAITALDILHKLYVEGQAVVAKMNPVNAYLRPHFEHVFGEFVEHGWLRFVDGGAAEGAY
ncbi:aldehyde dehydrogenase, partial [Kitasatospora indigofera]